MTKLPPIANHFGMFMADQKAKEKAKKDRVLPEGVTDKGNSRILSKEQEMNTALAYLLSDVIYQIMYILCDQMQSAGMDLRHETKYRFNELFKAASAFKNKALMVSKDVELLGNDKVFDDYFEDSEWLGNIITMLYNVSRTEPGAQMKIKSFIEQLSAKHK